MSRHPETGTSSEVSKLRTTPPTAPTPQDPFPFCQTLSELYTAEAVQGRSGKVLSTGALSTPRNLWTIRKLMFREQPAVTLEVGLCFGGSTLTFAATHMELDSGRSQCHIAVDPYQATVWDSVGVDRLASAGLAGLVTVIEKQSCVALPELLSQGVQPQLIYIDGSHLFEDVFLDFYFSFQLLPVGGILMFDDSADPHVKKVLHFISRNFSDRLRPLAPPIETVADWSRQALRKLTGRKQLTIFRKAKDGLRAWNAPFVNF